MSGKSFAALKKQLRDTEIQLEYFKSLVGAFSTGQLPTEGCSLQHFIFAQWGRRRLDELEKVPVLLRGDAGATAPV